MHGGSRPSPPHQTCLPPHTHQLSLTSALFNLNCPLPQQEYISLAHSLREELELRVRQAGVSDSIPTPGNLPWFDLLAHPAA